MGPYRQMEEVCDALDVPKLRESLNRQLRQNAVSQDLWEFAKAYKVHQAARRLADYDSEARLPTSDVRTLIGTAAAATEAFDRTNAYEQTDILVPMLIRARG